MCQLSEWWQSILTPCTSDQGFLLTLAIPAPQMHYDGVLVDVASAPPALVFTLCPTLALYVLLLFAVLIIGAGITTLVEEFFRKRAAGVAMPEEDIDAIVRDVLDHIDQASAHYLRKETL